jgi:hypothetical protein
MKTFKSFEYLSEYIGDDWFWYLHAVVVDKIDHGSSIHILHEHKQGLLVVIGEEVFRKVR